MKLPFKLATLTLLLIAMTGAQTLSAQGFLGGLLKGDNKATAAPKVNGDALLLRGTGILLCLSLANDRALAAQEKMLSAFPEEKLAAIREAFQKYNEAKAKRMADKNADASTLGPENELAAKAQEEIAKLLEETKEFKKGYGKQASEAYTQVAWALGIDLLAVIQLPGFLVEVKGYVDSIRSNPMQLLNVKAAGGLVLAVGGAIKFLPSQVSALKNVKAMAKQIADAENVKLEEPKSVAELNPNLLTGKDTSTGVDG